MLKRLLCACAFLGLPASANPVGPILHPPVVLAQQTPPADRPALAPTLRHAPPGLICATASGPLKSSESFVRSYSAATHHLTSQRFDEAVLAADAAAAFARTTQEWAAIESIRVAAFSRLDRPLEQLEALEALEAIGCGVSGRNRDAILGLRSKLGLPPP